MTEPAWLKLRAPHERCLAVVTFFHLKWPWHVPGFISRTGEIRRQLAGAEGLLGYSLRAKPLALKFWTLSAWETQRHLLDFISHPPHARIMRELQPRMRRFDIRRWKVDPERVPVDWREALARFDEDG